MITQAQINQHDQIIERFVRQFTQGIRPLFNSVFDEIAGLGSSVSRTAILALFAPIRTYIQQSFNQLDAIINSNRTLTASEIDNAIPTLELEQLRAEATVAVLNQLQTEQQSITQTLVLGAITGIAIAPLLSQLRTGLTQAINRIRNIFNFTIRNFDGALTLIRSKLAGINKFKYVGGTISTSRDFCRSHNGKIYTIEEINRIWRRQTWGGKAPGNPFVVRGGYNCRHMFVPVREENNASSQS
jgi:hypothetical protein